MHSSINHLIPSSHDPPSPSLPTTHTFISNSLSHLLRRRNRSRYDARQPTHPQNSTGPSPHSPPLPPHQKEKMAHTVNAQLAMSHNLFNLPLLLQIIQRFAREGPIDLEAIDEGGDGDETVGLHVLVEFVRGGLVEDDGVVGFVFDCFFLRGWEGQRG